MPSLSNIILILFFSKTLILYNKYFKLFTMFDTMFDTHNLTESIGNKQPISQRYYPLFMFLIHFLISYVFYLENQNC